MTQEIRTLVESFRKGSFAKTGYWVTIYLHNRERFMKSFELYSDYTSHDKGVDNTVEHFFEKITPEFQRSNNKWTLPMKVKFVENLLAGCPTEIKLFRVGKESHDNDAQVVDGLQRLTAIFDFMSSKFQVHGKSYEDLADSLSNFPTRLVLSVYDFDNWAQVGRYYVDMNENITHSAEDIQKAKDWFLANHNVVL